MKKYSKYKDSSVEWLGDIPENWEVGKFNLLIKIRHGHQFMSYDFTEDGIKIVKITQLHKDGFLDVSDCSHISQDRLNEFNGIVIKENDILMCLTGGTIGKIIRVGKITTPLLQNYRVGHFSSLDKNVMSDDFIFWIMSSDSLIAQIFFQMRETGQPNIGMGDFGRMKITIPTIQEQDQIAKYLDYKTNQIEILIANKQKLIELLKEERTAIINQAVTKGINPKAKLKPSGIDWLGDVPEHWEVKKLKYVVSKIGDGLHGTPSYVDASNYFFINGNNIGNGRINLKENPKCVSEEEYKVNKKSLTSNTILISINGTIGSLAFYNNELVMLGKSVAYINCKDIVNKEFVYYYLESEAAKNYIDQELSGSTIKNLSLYSINNLSIPFTIIAEQNEIVQFIKREQNRINTIITKTEQEIELMKEYKTALISEVVTGKVDVRDEKTK